MVNTLTLNPAIDKVLYLNEFKKNVTNRITHSLDTIGGKGTHVSINLQIIGQSSRAFGIAHGDTGLKIIEMLNQYHLDVRFIHKPLGKSRTNYLLVEDNQDSTLIAEKGVQLSDDDIAILIEKLREEIEPNDFLILAGDASNCIDLVYNQILSALKDKKLKIFLDTSGDTLIKCMEESPFLIKPNLDELSALCGRPISSSDDDVIAAIESLAPYKIDVIAVSLGKEGSIIKDGDRIYKAIPPKVRVVNTVGCGDCFMAGLAYGISHDLPIVETIRLATAVSAATAESPLSVGFDLKRAMELIEWSQVHQIR